MYTLGIHGGINTVKGEWGAIPYNWGHDAAAVLCKDGEVVAAFEEERFVRIKHVTYFPLEAIRHCLQHEKIHITEVAKIAISSKHLNYFLKLANQWRFGIIAEPEYTSYIELAASIIQDEFGSDVRGKLIYAGHHRSHTLSAVRQSGFADALCIVMDGYGDGLTGLISTVHGEKIEILSELREFGPAGMYMMGTQLLGFGNFDEYKVMGLAPYGDSQRYLAHLLKSVVFEPEGRFRFTRTLVPPECSSAKRKSGAIIEQHHKDFAAALQVLTEKILLHVVEHFQKATGLKKLCLAGGLAQNCSANGKVLKSGLFDDVFVQPASYDAGCAIGAAIHGFEKETGTMRNQALKHVYWGSNITHDSAALDSTFDAWRNVLEVERHPDVSSLAANLIAAGHVIGWVQGRAEFGARALGNRSILADPRPAENKRRINQMVKKREEFRPFAPSVLEEWLHEYFEVPDAVRYLPFMVFVVGVRSPYRELLGAITHVDGTARVQSVSQQTNARYWRLLERFHNLTSVPIVLNTSFNNNHEPIVNTAEEALNCYLSTHIDYLIIDDYFIQRKSDMGPSDVLQHLIPIMSHRFETVRHSTYGERPGYFVHDRYTDYRTQISAGSYYSLISAVERRVSFKEVMDTQMQNPASILAELHDLWCRRVFHCEGSAS